MTEETTLLVLHVKRQKAELDHNPQAVTGSRMNRIAFVLLLGRNALYDPERS